MGTKISDLAPASANEALDGFVPVVTGTTTKTTKKIQLSSVVSSGGGSSVTTDTTAPSNPLDGDLWFNENEAELYVFASSIDSWIQTNGGGGSGGEVYDSGWTAC